MSSEAITYIPNVPGGVEEGTQEIREDAACAPSQAEEGARRRVQNSPEISDEGLLEQVSRGTREALAVLFRRHAQAIRNIAQRILRDSAEADDLLQDVFLFIFRKAALFDPAKGSARSWIIQVAYHRAFNRRHYLTGRQHYRALQLDEEVLGPGALAPETPHGSSTIDAIFGQELLAKCKASLSPEQMRTLEQFFFEGYTLKEIAERTGQSLSNVRSYYYRGLERLRKLAMPEKARTT